MILVDEEVHAPLVGFHHLFDSVEVLHLKEFYFAAVRRGNGTDVARVVRVVQGNGLRFGVDLCLEGLAHDELADFFEDEWFFDLELLVDALDADRLVLVLTVDEEDLERNLFDLLEEGSLESSGLELSHVVEDFDLANVLVALLPFALMEISGSEDDEVTAGLWDELDTLLVVLFDELPEVSIDDLLLNGEAVLANVGDLEEHGGGHVDALNHVEVDVQMWWDLSLLLFDVFLNGLFLVLLVGADALSQALLPLWAVADVNQDRV